MFSRLKFHSFSSLAVAVLLGSAALHAAPLTQPANGALFVFHGSRSEAAVLDPATLKQVAAVSAPLGSFRALALPRPYNSTGASKYYILGPRAVTVLDGAFGVRTTIELPAVASVGSMQSVMSPDGRRLAIVAGRRLLLIDTVADRIAANLDVGFAAAAILPHPDGRRALLPASGAALARWVDFTADAMADGAVLLPTSAVAAGLSPDGAYAAWFGSDGFYAMADMDLPEASGDLDRLLSATAAPQAGLVDTTAQASKSRLVVTNSGRFFLQRQGELLFGRLGVSAATTEVALGSTRASDSAASAAPSWASSTDGDALYVALPGQGIVARLDPAGLRRTAAANLSTEISGVDLAAPRVEQQAGSLQILSENDRVFAGTTRFTLKVKAMSAAGDAQSGVAVFVTNIAPAGSVESCSPSVTASNGEATIDCRLGEIAQNTTVMLTISDDRGRNAPIASIAAIPPLLFEGLSKVEGDLQTVPNNSEFSVRVQAAKNRLPLAGATLSISVDPEDGVVSCPAAVVTGNTGFATITCTSGELADFKQNFFVSVEGADSSVDFSVTVDPLAGGEEGITKISGDGQTTVQGTQFPLPLVVSSVRDGAPRAKTTLNILTNPLGPIVCPVNVLTNNEGISSFRCSAKNVVFQGGSQQTFGQVGVADFGKQLQSPFVLTVTQSAISSARDLVLVSDEEVEIRVDQPVIDAIRVVAITESLPVQGVDVYFWSDDDIVIDPPMVKTDGGGVASATLTLGCNSNGRAKVFFGLKPDVKEGNASYKALPGPFARVIKVQGDGQSGSPGQALNSQALVARTTDLCGNTIPGQPMTWRVLPEVAATLRGVVSRSNNAGLVSALVTLGNYGGPFQVEIGNPLASARFDLAVELPGQQLRLRSGDDQMAGPGQTTTLPLVVDVLGVSGFGVAGVPVEFSITSGDAELVSPSAMTNGVGVAFAKVRSNTTGAIQVTAKAVGQQVVFALNGNSGPAVTREGIVNAASFQPGLTPGGAGSIFGQFLSNADGVVAADSVPFPTRLAGVQVRINGVPAPLIAVVNSNGSEQINFQTPFQTAAGQATIEIDNNGIVSTVQGVQVNSLQPGVFEINIENQRIAAALHQDSTLITPSSPAIPGEAVQLYFTGGGPLTPPVLTNTPGPIDPLPLTATSVVVGVDDVGQQVIASFYAPTLVTAYQTNFTLNPATPAGNRMLVLKMGDSTSPTVMLPVGGAAAINER